MTGIGTVAAVAGGNGGATYVESGYTEVTQAGGHRVEKMRSAKMQGYEGDPCEECGNFTMVRNGTCLKCMTCGSTSGCS
jgi:ribonucleoside-diphosphate reductase alpha chain